MEYLERSVLLSFVVRLWEWIIKLFQGSLLYKICIWTRDKYRQGIVKAILSREGRLAYLWNDSLLSRILSWILNLPARFLNYITEKCGWIKNSVILKFISEQGKTFSCAILSVLLFAILACPYSAWNNMYALILAAAALALVWVNGMFTPNRINIIDVGPWPVFYLLICVMSGLWSFNIGISFRYIFFHITCAMIVVVCISAVDTPRKLHCLVTALGVGLLICSAYALYQRYIGIEPNASYTDLAANPNMPGRVYSFFENPNTFASVIVFFAPLMFVMALYSPGKLLKLGFTAAFLISCVALIMTYSRGGWLAFAISMVILFFILFPRWVPFFCLLVLATVPFWPSSILSRILSIFTSSDSSISSRSYIYWGVIRLTKRNCLFGVGLGTTNLRTVVNASGLYEGGFPFVHAHNILLETWGESGVFAAAALVMTMFKSLRSGGRAARIKDADQMTKGIAAGAVSGIVGAIAAGMFDNIWAYPRVMIIFWSLFAILLTAVRIAQNSKKAGNING